MKKFLPFFLVLILTCFACSNSDPSIFSASESNIHFESSESEFAEEEIYSFAHSQKALDFVKKVSEQLGGVTYLSLCDTDDISRFKLILAPEIAALGQSSADPYGRFVEYSLSVEKASELVEKYFGVKYLNTFGQKNVSVYIYPDPDPSDWNVENISLQEISKTLVTYRVDLTYKNSSFDYCAETTFEVCKDSGGLYLKTISNKLSSNRKEPLLEQQAVSLAEQLAELMLKEDLPGIESLTDQQIERFLIRLCSFSYESDMFDERSPYYRYFYQDFSGLWHFPLKAVDQISYELFGNKNFSFGDSLEFDSTSQEYVSGLEFGSGGVFSASDVSFHSENDRIYVTFNLTDSQYFPSQNSYGEYTVTFLIMTEGGCSFLRFEKFEPITEQQ